MHCRCDRCWGTGWISRDKNGSVTRHTEFRKYGVFVAMMDQRIYAGVRKQDKGRIKTAVKYRELVTSAGIEGAGYVVYLANVVEGKLKGMSAHYYDRERRRSWESPIDLEQE